MKSIFPAAIDGDLLKLVHLSNGFRTVDGAKPLAVSDICKAKARIISVVNASEEKSSRLRALFIVKANASSKSCRHSCTVDVFQITRTPLTPLRNPIMSFLSSRTRTLASFSPRSGSDGRTSLRRPLSALLLFSASSHRCHARIGLRTATFRSPEISSSRTS